MAVQFVLAWEASRMSLAPSHGTSKCLGVETMDGFIMAFEVILALGDVSAVSMRTYTDMLPAIVLPQHVMRFFVFLMLEHCG